MSIIFQYRLQITIHHPSSVIRHPSSVIRHPSSIIHHPSSMCTVTYIPINKSEFFLTSNRDEAPSRAAKTLEERIIGTEKIVFPKDTQAGGTWIAVSSEGRVVCILNGAFKQHQRIPPYRRSRGLMALDFFSFARVRSFFDQYQFHGMEPFTMIVYQEKELFEVRWDGKKLHIKKLNILEAYIWSSATLYDAEMRAKRENWFENWLGDTPAINQSSIIDLHLHGGEGDPNVDYVMNRGEVVKTVSTTSITKNINSVELLFKDLTSKLLLSKKLDLVVPQYEI